MNHLVRELAPVSDAAWREIQDEATRTLKHFLTARRLRMRLSLLPLLRQRLVVDRVVVDEPVVRLVCDRAGRLNVATLGGRARRANAAPSPPAHHGPAFQLGALRLRHGTVRYTDRATGRSLELTEVAVDAREPRFGAPMPIAVPPTTSTAAVAVSSRTAFGRR